jgi:biopolymer transport protein ExbD
VAGEERAPIKPGPPPTAEEEEALLQRLLKEKKRRQRGKEPTMNMTPMIDGVFLLIIFFMVVTELSKMEIESITLPFALEAKEDTEPEEKRLIVNVVHDGKIVVSRERISGPERLKAILQAKADASGREGGLPKLSVKIRGDANVEYKYVQNVIVQCMRVYVWNLSFGANPIKQEDEHKLLY